MDQFNGIVSMYRETWEKARLTASALGVEIPLPWDKKFNPPKYGQQQRISLGKQLSKQQQAKKPKAMQHTKSKQWRILIYVPVWQRPEIFNICLQGIIRLTKYKPDTFKFIPFFVISESWPAEILNKYNYKYLFHQNSPLGAKKNAGIKYAVENIDFDYVLELGSDDIVKNEYFDFVLPYIEAEAPQFNLSTCHFVDTNTGKNAYWKTTLVLGLARMIHRKPLAYLIENEIDLWIPTKNRGMDTCSHNTLVNYGYKNTLIHTDKVFTLDIKSDVNINKIETFKPTTYTTTQLLAHFPEGELIQKLIDKNK